MKKNSALITLLLLTACASTPPKTITRTTPPPNTYTQVIQQAEAHSTGRTKAILAQARTMTLVKPEIIRGGCWDYLDTVWTRAGIPRQQRQTVFASNINGQYANTNFLQTGDWIYHINHSYHNSPHSGMFIAWIDKSRQLGLTLSYAGERRQEPARYKVYDLSSVYTIIRPK